MWHWSSAGYFSTAEIQIKRLSDCLQSVSEMWEMKPSYFLSVSTKILIGGKRNYWISYCYVKLYYKQFDWTRTFLGGVLFHIGLYHANIHGSYECVRFGAICHLTSCTVLKNIEITSKVCIEDSHISYVLEPKEKLLQRTSSRALVATEQCN